MANEDYDVKHDIRILLQKTYNTKTSLIILGSLDHIMHGLDAVEFVRLMQRWLAAV